MNYTPLNYTPFDPLQMGSKRKFPMKALLVLVLMIGVGGSSLFVYQNINSFPVLRDSKASEPVQDQEIVSPTVLPSPSPEPEPTVPEATESGDLEETSLEEYLNKRKQGVQVDQTSSP